jgi:hypothetical protein
MPRLFQLKTQSRNDLGDVHSHPRPTPGIISNVSQKCSSIKPSILKSHPKIKAFSAASCLFKIAWFPDGVTIRQAIASTSLPERPWFRLLRHLDRQPVVLRSQPVRDADGKRLHPRRLPFVTAQPNELQGPTRLTAR